MIDWIIRASLANRGLVLLLAAMLAGFGMYSLLRTPVDALPDLSDVQVIVRTSYPGQAPRVVEDQVTYPLTTALLSVPGATTVRGYSFYGDSFVNVLFADGTDPYWAPTSPCPRWTGRRCSPRCARPGTRPRFSC